MDPDDFPSDVTLPAVVWENVAEDLRAIADAIAAQLGGFDPPLAEEAYLTLRFPHPEIHAALELIARAQVGDEAFEALMEDLEDQPETGEAVRQ